MEQLTTQALRKMKYQEFASTARQLNPLAGQPEQKALRMTLTEALVYRPRHEYLRAIKEQLNPTGYTENERPMVLKALMTNWLTDYEKRKADGFKDGVPQLVGRIIYTTQSGLLVASAIHPVLIQSGEPTATVSLTGSPIRLEDLFNAFQTGNAQPLSDPKELITIDQGIESWAKQHQSDRIPEKKAEAVYILNMADTRSNILGI